MTAARVFLTGATGFLGRYLHAALTAAGAVVVAPGRAACNLLDPRSLDGALARAGTPFLVHAAALAVLDACERDPAQAEQANVRASVALCGQARRWLLVSTDLVFGGDQAPYDEAAPPAPLSVYGRTKVDAERAVLERGGGVVARVPLLFGQSPTGDRGATDMVRAAVRSGQPARLFVDEFRTPLHAVHAARVLVALLLDEACVGVAHVPGPERIDRFALGQRFVRCVGLPAGCVVPASRRGFAGARLRPADVSLRSRRVLPAVPALDAMLAEA